MLATANDAALHHSELLPRRDAIATELRQPGTASAEARATPDTAVAIADGQRVAVETIIVTGRRQDAKPIAQTATRIDRSEEHTSELQSLMRISYAVFCLKKKNKQKKKHKNTVQTIIQKHQQYTILNNRD